MRDKMKNYLMTFAICMAFSMPSFAEPMMKQKPVQCATPIEVINHYILPHKLNVMFLAVGNVTTQFEQQVVAPISFWFNTESGKFLMLEGTVEEVCVISLGDRMQFDVDQNNVLGLYLQNGS